MVSYGGDTPRLAFERFMFKLFEVGYSDCHLCGVFQSVWGNAGVVPALNHDCFLPNTFQL